MHARTASLIALVCLGACSPPDPAPGSGSERETPPVLIIGWDGASFELLDPLLRAGALPNVARLAERGRTAVLDSTIVPISSAAWVSAVTGGSPGEHGVYDFFEPLPDSYGVRLVSAESNHLPPLWRTLTWHGLRSIVFGVPLTWPPEELDGVLVAGMLSPFDADYTWPPELADELRAAHFQPDLGIWREDRELTPQRMQAQLTIKRDAVLAQLAGDWDFAMIVFKSLDVLSHRVYSPDPGGPVGQWMMALDSVLGELLDAVGPDVNVLLVSDHGFHSYKRNFFTHAWLLEAGLAVRKTSAAASGPGGGPLAEARAMEHTQRIGELDLARSVAFAGSAEGNYGGIRLNIAGREPAGIVPPEEAQALMDRIDSELRALVIPGTDTPMVVGVVRAARFYPGEHAGILPDLLFEMHPSIAVRPTPNPVAFLELGGRFPDHAREGILIAAGPSLAPAVKRGRADIADLAPMVLHLLDLPIYEEMSGRVHSKWFTGERSVRSISGVAHAAGRGGVFHGATDVEDAGVMDALEALGYLDGDTEDEGGADVDEH